MKSGGYLVWHGSSLSLFLSLPSPIPPVWAFWSSCLQCVTGLCFFPLFHFPLGPLQLFGEAPSFVRYARIHNCTHTAYIHNCKKNIYIYINKFTVNVNIHLHIHIYIYICIIDIYVFICLFIDRDTCKIYTHVIGTLPFRNSQCSLGAFNLGPEGFGGANPTWPQLATCDLRADTDAGDHKIHKQCDFCHDGRDGVHYKTFE